MWHGVYPAISTKFTPDGALDHAEMERCFGRLLEAGCHGLIACGSLGEGNMLTQGERLQVLDLARVAAGGRPVLLTISEPGTREACTLAAAAARAGADGLMVVPSPIYPTDFDETLANLNAIAAAGGLPVMIYSNRIAYRVDVTGDMLAELAGNPLMVAIKESSDDIRRTTEILARFGDRFTVLTGVDNLAMEALAMGASGWVAGLVLAFPEETVALYDLVRSRRMGPARQLYHWFRPLLDLDVSSFLVQQIKLAEVLALGSTEHVRAPRLPLRGAHRAQVEAVIRHALATRPDLAQLMRQPG